MTNADDHEVKIIRVYRKTWRAIRRIQMEREAEAGRMQSMPQIMDEAVALLEKEVTH